MRDCDTRLQREALSQPHAAVRELVHRLCAFEGVPEDWRTPDLSILETPVLPFTLRRETLRVSFLTTTTVFNAPHDIGLEELQVESFFPLDEPTVRICTELT